MPNIDMFHSMSTKKGRTPGPNTVAYYKLDGNANDSSGNGNNGTATNVTWVDGILCGGAASFNGSSSEVLVSNNLGITGGDITLSLWIKLNAEIGSGLWVIACQMSATNAISYSLRYDYNGGTRRVSFTRTSRNILDAFVHRNGALGTTDWHNLILTQSGTTLTGYYNGSLVGSTYASGNGSGSYDNRFTIGIRPEGGFFTNAQIDEVIIENRARTPKEVLDYYNTSK